MAIAITPVPSTVASIDAPDTRDMVVIHKIFRREFRLLPGMVRRTAAHDGDRTEAVAGWVLGMVDFLNHHNTNEDELVWPRLALRCPFDAELVETAERQHSVVAALLEPIPALAARWAAEPSAANRDVLALALDPIHAALVEHLDLEEREILPLVRRFMTRTEYEELGERGRASIPPEKMMTVLGTMLEDATPEERDMMAAGLPTPAKAAWLAFGKRQHRREMRRLRSSD